MFSSDEEGMLSDDVLDGVEEEDSSGAVEENELPEAEWLAEDETTDEVSDCVLEAGIAEDVSLEKEDDCAEEEDKSTEASPREGEADIQPEKTIRARMRQRNNCFILYLHQYFFRRKQ